MEFQIGSCFIKISLTDEYGNLFKAVVVTPIGNNLMMAARFELSNLRSEAGSAIPAAFDQVIYKRGQKYPEEMVKGFIANV